MINSKKKKRPAKNRTLVSSRRSAPNLYIFRLFHIKSSHLLSLGGYFACCDQNRNDDRNDHNNFDFHKHNLISEAEYRPPVFQIDTKRNLSQNFHYANQK